MKLGFTAKERKIITELLESTSISVVNKKYGQADVERVRNNICRALSYLCPRKKAWSIYDIFNSIKLMRYHKDEILQLMQDYEELVDKHISSLKKEIECKYGWLKDKENWND